MNYKVKSMIEALELANKFKKEGRYDLFRGQAKDWEVASSASRISDNSKVIKEIQTFYSFCENNELLKHYIDLSGDEFIAIAQHYGLKTNFVDFTSSPEIAMYFATHSESCKIGEECVIVCLNKTEFNTEISSGFIQHVISMQNLPTPRIIEVDLINLWRLKAQKGCFLELQLMGFDKKLYHFDRIYFPYSKPFSNIQETDIYPERKSPIEIELDKYFMDMLMMENTKRMESVSNVIKIEIDTKPPHEAYDKILKNYSKLLAHSSWDNLDNDWSSETRIEWKYQKYRVQIEIDTQKLSNEDSSYYNELVAMISQHRGKLINIELINSKNFACNISEKVQRIYDGMNVLPYDDEHIVNAIKELLHIELHFENMTDKIEVEFGERDNGRGFYSRAFILENDYELLLRKDILEYINPQYLSENSNTEDIRKHILKSIINLSCDIRLISNFNDLVDLFAKRIIPFQIYTNRKTILFNPSKIIVFGRP